MCAVVNDKNMNMADGMPPSDRGWHRKWMLLVIFLAWTFLFRFRLLGLILSKAITYKLSQTQPANVQVSIKHATVRPLQLLAVEVVSDEGWRVLFTKICVRSYLKDFFRSFGQQKIIVLELDEIRVRVQDLNYDLLRKRFAPTTTTARRDATKSE